MKKNFKICKRKTTNAKPKEKYSKTDSNNQNHKEKRK